MILKHFYLEWECHYCRRHSYKDHEIRLRNSRKTEGRKVVGGVGQEGRRGLVDGLGVVAEAAKAVCQRSDFRRN